MTTTTTETSRIIQLMPANPGTLAWFNKPNPRIPNEIYSEPVAAWALQADGQVIGLIVTDTGLADAERDENFYRFSFNKDSQ